MKNLNAEDWYSRHRPLEVNYHHRLYLLLVWKCTSRVVLLSIYDQVANFPQNQVCACLFVVRGVSPGCCLFGTSCVCGKRISLWIYYGTPSYLWWHLLISFCFGEGFYHLWQILISATSIYDKVSLISWYRNIMIYNEW